jgi:hypothetical protein
MQISVEKPEKRLKNHILNAKTNLRKKIILKMHSTERRIGTVGSQ